MLLALFFFFLRLSLLCLWEEKGRSAGGPASGPINDGRKFLDRKKSATKDRQRMFVSLSRSWRAHHDLKHTTQQNPTQTRETECADGGADNHRPGTSWGFSSKDESLFFFFLLTVIKGGPKGKGERGCER